jgi:hypothetical protein
MVRARWSVFAAVWSCWTLVAWGHSPTLPDNWRELSAGEFTTALAAAAQSADVPADLRTALYQHAWDRFLADPAFIAQGEWPTVVKLVELGAGQATGEMATAKQAELKSRLAERLANDPQLTAGVDLHDVGRMTKSFAATGFNAEDTARVFLDWKAKNDWRSLPLHDLYNLYSWINVDSLDRRHFSARWTGFITAPVAGDYVFRQIQQYSGTNSKLVITIGDKEVLNSTDKSRGEERFVSSAVTLPAGERVPVRVEMTHDVTRIDFSEGAPMVALTWEHKGAPATFIPTTAFTPPEGAASDTKQGLQGEYFSDLKFSVPKLTRIDPALDLIWSWPPTASIHNEHAAEVFKPCVDQVLDESVLARAAGEENAEFFAYSLWRIVYRMTGAQRQELVTKLSRNPQVLAAMTPEAIGRLYEGVYMLPGKEQLDLLGEWALARPQPRTQAGQFPGWGDGYYQKLNTDFYWLIGKFMQGPYWDDVEQLCEQYLERSDGECSLAIAYAAAFATRNECFRRRDRRHSQRFYDLLQKQLDNKNLEGDQRVTWLLAMAFADESIGAPTPHPRPYTQHLVEARLVAKSPDYQFWATQEVGARLASLGATRELEALLEKAPVTSNQQREMIARWREVAPEVERINEARALKDLKDSEQALVKELERRALLAEQAQSPSEAEQYRSMIQMATKELAKQLPIPEGQAADRQ